MLKKFGELSTVKQYLDYHKLYLKVDVLILADAFEKFREFFLS